MVHLSIAAVERDTGLSKDTLRVWERRYGFPQPARDGIGERAYPLDQVERLRIVKRLLDGGHRPGRVVPMPLPALQQLAESTVDHPQRKPEAALASADLEHLVRLIRSHDVPALRHELLRLLARLGVRGFVIDVVSPLNLAVGDAWMRGQLQIFEEHAYSEVIQSTLRQALATIPAQDGRASPRVLLTTVPGEPHGLGLLMAEVILALEGCSCVSLGVQTPVHDIARAAVAMRSQIVALGFTGCLSPRQVHDSLTELRTELPPAVQLWAGGSAPGLQRRPVGGVQRVDTLTRLPQVLRQRLADLGA
jgi:DNA-binding transcriptional MerR regulator/methylmalonyl-CoA mutase cobalamin-binding subunit